MTPLPFCVCLARRRSRQNRTRPDWPDEVHGLGLDRLQRGGRSRRLGPLPHAARRDRPAQAHPDRGISTRPGCGSRPTASSCSTTGMPAVGARRQQHVRHLRPRHRRLPTARNAVGPRPRVPWASWGPDSKPIAMPRPAASGSSTSPPAKDLRTMPRSGHRPAARLVARRPRRSRARPTGWARTGTSAGWTAGQRSRSPRSARPNGTTARPDWMPDSRSTALRAGHVPETDGRAQLWIASGRRRGPAHALRRGRTAHLRRLRPRPTGEYLLFTPQRRGPRQVDHSRRPRAIVRMADTPMLGDDDDALRKHVSRRQARDPRSTSGRAGSRTGPPRRFRSRTETRRMLHGIDVSHLTALLHDRCRLRWHLVLRTPATAPRRR